MYQKRLKQPISVEVIFYLQKYILILDHYKFLNN